jgi:hypothetical protein
MQGGPSADAGPPKTKVGNWSIPPVSGPVDMIGSASRRRTTGICALPASTASSSHRGKPPDADVPGPVRAALQGQQDPKYRRLWLTCSFQRILKQNRPPRKVLIFIFPGAPRSPRNGNCYQFAISCQTKERTSCALEPRSLGWSRRRPRLGGFASTRIDAPTTDRS